MSVGISIGEIHYLYHPFLRTARQFPDYNIREYTKRSTVDSFHQNQTSPTHPPSPLPMRNLIFILNN
jgi:hypothetical protein